MNARNPQPQTGASRFRAGSCKLKSLEINCLQYEALGRLLLFRRLQGLDMQIPRGLALLGETMTFR